MTKLADFYEDPQPRPLPTTLKPVRCNACGKVLMEANPDHVLCYQCFEKAVELVEEQPLDFGE